MRGRDMNKEIIEPLEKARAVARVTEPNKAGYKCIEQHIDQALNFVKQQPPVGEFTKIFRADCEVAIRDCDISEKQIQNVLNNTGLLGIKVRLSEGRRAGKQGLEACDRLDSAESINADLTTICEQVQDWLDTSSLQKVLVHCTDAKEKDALIMGVASFLDGNTHNTYLFG